MILSGRTIRALCNPPTEAFRQLPLIDPFSERTKLNGLTYGVGPAGYDVRLRQEVNLMPGKFMLGSIVEHISMPRDVLAIVHDKSILACLGLALQNTVIEPGWCGYLIVEISNHGRDRVRLPAGSPIAQLIFHSVDTLCDPYDDPVKALFDV